MDGFSLKDIITLTLTGLGGLGVGGVLVALIGKGKTDAERGKLRAETIVTFADGWESLAKEYKKGMEDSAALVETIRKQMIDLTELIETERNEAKSLVREKNKEIRHLTHRVGVLERTLASNGINVPSDADLGVEEEFE